MNYFRFIMEQSFSQRVKKIIESEGFKDNPKAFADFIGMKRPDMLYKVVNGETEFSQNLFDYISNKYPNINKDWLKRGKGEMLVLEKEASESDTPVEFSKDYLIKENIRLHRKLELLLEEALKTERESGSKKDITIELQEEIKRLQAQLNKKMA